MGLGSVVEEGKIHALACLPMAIGAIIVLYTSKQLTTVR
jgi:hypothetical protein